MTDPADTSNQLPLDAPETPPAPPPAPSAEDKPAATKPAPRKAGGSGSKTKGKVTAPKAAGKKAIGARPRKKAGDEPAAAKSAVEDRVTIVLQTSRFRGRDGRAIARRTPVLVTVERGLELIIQGYARESVDGDKPAAAYLD